MPNKHHADLSAMYHLYLYLCSEGAGGTWGAESHPALKKKKRKYVQAERTDNHKPSHGAKIAPKSTSTCNYSKLDSQLRKRGVHPQ